MKPERINQLIAEHCGWENFEPGQWDGWPFAIPPNQTINNKCRIPDYCADLNAMHEAEKVLFKSSHTDTLNRHYWDHLWRVCHDGYCKLTTIAHATASQRAEAFLKTIGKWQDG